MQAASYKTTHLTFYNKCTALTKNPQDLSPQELGQRRTEGTKALGELGFLHPELYRLPEIIECVTFYLEHKDQKICIKKLSQEERSQTLNQLKIKKPTEIYKGMTICLIAHLAQLDLFLIPTDLFDPEFQTTLETKKALPYKQIPTEQHDDTILLDYSLTLNIEFERFTIDGLLEHQSEFWPHIPSSVHSRQVPLHLTTTPEAYTHTRTPVMAAASNVTLTIDTELLDEHQSSGPETPLSSTDSEREVTRDVVEDEEVARNIVDVETSSPLSETTPQVALHTHRTIEASIRELTSKTIQDLNNALDQTASLQEKICIGVMATVRVSQELATVDPIEPDETSKRDMRDYNTILQKLRICCPNYIQSNKWNYSIAETAVALTKYLPGAQWLQPNKSSIDGWAEELQNFPEINGVHWNMFKKHLVYPESVTRLLNAFNIS